MLNLTPPLHCALTLNIIIRSNFVGFINTAPPAERLENSEYHQYIDAEVQAINDVIAQNLNLFNHCVRYYVDINPLKYSFFFMFPALIAYGVTKISALLYVGLAMVVLFTLSAFMACAGQYQQVAYIYPVKNVLDGPVQDYLRNRPTIRLDVKDSSTKVGDSESELWKWSLDAELSFHSTSST